MVSWHKHKECFGSEVHGARKDTDTSFILLLEAMAYKVLLEILYYAISISDGFEGLSSWINFIDFVILKIVTYSCKMIIFMKKILMHIVIFRNISSS